MKTAGLTSGRPARKWYQIEAFKNTFSYFLPAAIIQRADCGDSFKWRKITGSNCTTQIFDCAVSIEFPTATKINGQDLWLPIGKPQFDYEGL